MSEMKITVNGKPIGEYVKEKQEEEFLKRTYSFDVRTTIAEKEENFIIERIINSDFGFGYKEEQKLSKERLRRALWLLAEEEEGRLVYTGHPHEDAIETLTKSGWLRDHDREIYEQGRTDTIQVMRCREISRALAIANKEMKEGD